ncbi:MAG: hypothetical protein Q8O79_01575 [Pseudomonadota bacterium]|nr:hypothetical protein [Pseudomonadota bacterium]
MASIGYARLVTQLGLSVRPLRRPAEVSRAVNRRVAAEDRVLFPAGVAIEDTPLGHLEFALRHEGVNLEVIEAAFAHISPASLVERLHATPVGRYVDLFPADEYVTASATDKPGPEI